jgi:hypothetical protein
MGAQSGPSTDAFFKRKDADLKGVASMERQGETGSYDVEKIIFTSESPINEDFGGYLGRIACSDAMKGKLVG